MNKEISCYLCKKEIASSSEFPMFITVFGELIDGTQLAYDVCVDCYTNRHLEILKLLKENKNEYS